MTYKNSLGDPLAPRFGTKEAEILEMRTHCQDLLACDLDMDDCSKARMGTLPEACAYDFLNMRTGVNEVYRLCQIKVIPTPHETPRR